MINGFADFKMSTPGEISDYYGTKSTSQLSSEELANIHLDIGHRWHCLTDGNISSNIYDLNEAVNAAFNNFRTKQYVPLLACFAILDQVGSLYQRADMESPYGNGIKKAFDSYSDLKSPETLDTLVTLRHGLLHNGSLTCINRNTKTKVFFRMITNSKKIYTPSKKQWDGIYHDSMADYTSFIDLKELHNKTKDILIECRRLLLNGKIDIKICAPRELFFKYLFLVCSNK
ncbi:hypothetical protein [Pseudomonas sp.]|uniref:hypothetical protein n=1 Tax=Pseudomonas sp. TaxID=306 RepID=UPI0028A951C3|nr:hypothetical protein [Pseudomonas sp.]